MSESDKAWIDAASYEDLLRRWRFAPLGDPVFQGETGQHYIKVMGTKKREVGQGGHVAASKAIGWDAPNRGSEDELREM
jgi:hypothetical protein